MVGLPWYEYGHLDVTFALVQYSSHTAAVLQLAEGQCNAYRMAFRTNLVSTVKYCDKIRNESRRLKS